MREVGRCDRWLTCGSPGSRCGESPQRLESPTCAGRSRWGSASSHTVEMGSCLGDFSQCLLQEAGRPFFEEASCIINYLEVRADEPCGRSTLVSLRGLFQVLEEMAGIDPTETVAGDPIVQNFIEGLLRSALAQITGGKVQAPRYPAAVVEALERLVVDDGAPRMLACTHGGNWSASGLSCDSTTTGATVAQR